MKKVLRHIISAAAALALLAAAIFPAGAAQQTAGAAGPFQDVPAGSWYASAVDYVLQEGLFSGTSASAFSPAATMTRGMAVQVLANLAGADTGPTGQYYADVAPGSWYAGAVEWAGHYGIASGTGKFTFQPNAFVTREQMAAMLYRYANAAGNSTGPGDKSGSFSDMGRVSDFAREAVDWAVSWGILKGSGGMLRPTGKITRAEAAQMFYNARGLFPKKAMAVPPVELPVPDELELRLYGMSLEEKVGQLFLPRYPGDAAGPEMAREYAPAGYVFFQPDFRGRTKDQVRSMIAKCQAAASTPLLTGVDEEGGTVVRVSINPNLVPEPYDSPQDIYRKSGLKGLAADTKSKSETLLGLGINLNLAPVCDVSTDPQDFIYPRSLGIPARDSAAAITAMVEAMEGCGISGSLKHFPGYGGNLDTHTGISVDDRPYSHFEQEDFLPFQAGIDAGAPGVMVSHNIVNCMDSKRPASLSRAVHDVLRRELGFEGVIMSDDLSMDAVKLYTEDSSPAVEAFQAGNDLLLTSDWVSDYEALLAAARDGTVAVRDIEDSVMRILKLKQAKGLI